jgi:AraC-like DNA-binding protein
VLIINLGPPFRLVDQGSPAANRCYQHGFLAGLSDHIAITDSGGESSGLQVDFSPVGGRLFLGRPLREVTNQTVDIEDLLGAPGRDLTELLRATPDWPARFAMVDSFVGARFEHTPGVPPDLMWVWRQLARSGGRASIGALAAELGISRTRLSGRFGTELGLPPKTLARILRFRAVVTGLTSGDSLAELAQRCGYYDQAHLNRDFREFAGATPTEYLRRALPDAGGVVEI